MPRGRCVPLASCDGVAEFIARHRGDPEKCGARQNHLWKPRYHGRPYCFRFDAVKNLWKPQGERELDGLALLKAALVALQTEVA